MRFAEDKNDSAPPPAEMEPDDATEMDDAAEKEVAEVEGALSQNIRARADAPMSYVCASPSSCDRVHHIFCKTMHV